MNHLIDIIIPTRNRFSLTAQAIDSVRRQTFRSWQLIVVDDASDDGSRELLHAHVAGDERIQLVERAERGGEQAARQTGLVASSASFIGLLDSDDLWMPTKLEKQVARFHARRSDLPNLGAVLCWHRWTDMEGRPRGAPGKPRGDGCVGPLVSSNMSSILVLRDAVIDAGGFLPATMRSLQTCAGIEFYIRLSQRCEFITVEEVLVHCREHSENRASDALKDRLSAEELAYVLGVRADILDTFPVERAQLLARAGARFMNTGSKRTGLSYLLGSLRGAGLWSATGIVRRYGPFAAKTLVLRR